ncbi:MAG: hypothetical protein DLM72_21615 [Candidatus Nitrosopolaris wilkensis]|nr:MAG: hypothetical protein DLM72_21615 [Candidatus Nitrosopolaris wilkensis]
MSFYFLIISHDPVSGDTIRDTGGAGTKVSTKSDSTREYETREPMSPAKIKEHEPTAVKSEITEKITQGGKRDCSKKWYD